MPVKEDVNKLKNADFGEGVRKPRGWTYVSSCPEAEWERAEPPGMPGVQVLTLTTEEARGAAQFVQEVSCKPDEYYRVEATVACDLEAEGEDRGLVLTLEPVSADKEHQMLRTPALHRSTEPVDLRACYHAPEGARRVRVSIGVHDACGAACIYQVRFIRILEPDDEGHALAVTPPAVALPPPLKARTVTVCSEAAGTRPITGILAGALGAPNVRTLTPSQLRLACDVGDALLLPDAEPPRAVRSVASLVKLAEERIVIISLPAFAKLADPHLKLRRIEQDDDSICAKVVYANYATRGFALEDIFPYAWGGKKLGSCAQHQFRRTPAQKEYCRQQGLLTLLDSMCDQESTSDRPICFQCPTKRGSLFVLDIEPAESRASTFGEPVLAIHLLLTILGRRQAPLGRYVYPQEREVTLREEIRELAVRHAGVKVHDADVPIEQVTEQLLTVGWDDETYGPPLPARPVILLRSGLCAGDLESVYGVWTWLRQLLHPEPYCCPYARELVSRFRLAWEPSVTPWEWRPGWQGSGRPPRREGPRLLEDGKLALLVDVVSRPRNEVRVVLPSAESKYQRYVNWLPQLAAAFAGAPTMAKARSEKRAGSGRGVFTLSPPAELEHLRADRDQLAWRWVVRPPRIESDPAAFRGAYERRALAAGAEVVRLEIPGSAADLAAHSIERTDLSATLLEHVVGLQLGLAAVNRTEGMARVAGFAPVAPGEALIVQRDDPMLRARVTQAG